MGSCVLCCWVNFRFLLFYEKTGTYHRIGSTETILFNTWEMKWHTNGSKLVGWPYTAFYDALGAIQEKRGCSQQKADLTHSEEGLLYLIFFFFKEDFGWPDINGLNIVNCAVFGHSLQKQTNVFSKGHGPFINERNECHCHYFQVMLKYLKLNVLSNIVVYNMHIQIIARSREFLIIIVFLD